MDICLRKRVWLEANHRHITADPSLRIDTGSIRLDTGARVSAVDRKKGEEKRNVVASSCSWLVLSLGNESRNLGVLWANTNVAA